ncbi:MAG: GNAT family N-acetyltransferase [Bacteroidota bacterium]
MIILDKKYYHKLLPPLAEVKINHQFARAVLEQKVSGTVYADSETNPACFYVLHPYGMSLLFGECGNPEFNARFREHALNMQKTRKRFEWMQAYPNDWHQALNNLFGSNMIRYEDNKESVEENIIELNTRVNFRFNESKFRPFVPYGSEINIVRTGRELFADMKGSVVPASFWDNADDFCVNGVGFSLFFENKLASTAYSAFRFDNMLELGIETSEEFRGKGLAKYACSALISHCLENGLEPVWACRLENTGSYRLALSLGFDPVLETPYYRLSR